MIGPSPVARRVPNDGAGGRDRHSRNVHDRGPARPGEPHDRYILRTGSHLRGSSRRRVVAASRCGAGDTLRSTYGVPGTEIDLQERGVLMAGTLSPAKARLRLQVALANGVAPPSVFPFED
jgi:hypothetical protein